MLLDWQLHASTFSPLICKAMNKRSLPGLHLRGVEDIQEPFSHLTKPLLLLELRENENCAKRCQIQKKNYDIYNVIARPSGD